MSERRKAVFLERRLYRRHRLMDWVRVLPFIGFVLWMTPLLWDHPLDAPVRTAGATIYIFLVWLLLILLSGGSAWLLKRHAASEDKAPAEEV